MPKQPFCQSSVKAARHKLVEGIGTVADLVLFPPVHLAKGHIIAIGKKNRVISVAIFTTLRPDYSALHFAFEHLVVSVWPSQDQRTAKFRQPRLQIAALLEEYMNFVHCHVEVSTSLGFCPIGSINPWGTV